MKRPLLCLSFALLVGQSFACLSADETSAESAEEDLKSVSPEIAARFLGAWTLTDDELNTEPNAKRFASVVFFSEESNRAGGKMGRQFMRDHHGMAASDPTLRRTGEYFLTKSSITLRSWRSDNPKDYIDDRYTYEFTGSGPDERLLLGGKTNRTAILRRVASYCVADASAASDCREVESTCSASPTWTCAEHTCSASCGEGEGEGESEKASGEKCLVDEECASGTCLHGFAGYICK